MEPPKLSEIVFRSKGETWSEYAKSVLCAVSVLFLGWIVIQVLWS
jgi:hypothetical protein